MSSSASNSSHHRKLALIISNGNYSRSNNKISHSANKVNNLAEKLQSISFKVTKYTDIQTDPEMFGNVKKFADEITDGDIILFYYSGQSDHVNNKNYLIPIKDDIIESDRDVEDIATSADKILERLVEKNTSYITLFILDCCKSYMRKAGPKSKNATESKGLREMKLTNGALIQFACAPNQTAPGELYSKHLLKNITKRKATIENIFHSIMNDVYEESNQTQKPLTINGLHKHGETNLNKQIIMIPNIVSDAKWQSQAHTIAGGLGLGTDMNKLNCPQGICIDENQTILVADISNHRIMEYTRDKKEGRRIAGKTTSGYNRGHLSGPLNVINDADSKRFIICDSNNRQVLQWTRGSSKKPKIMIDNVACSGLAMDDEGSIYISDSQKHEVRRYCAGERKGTIVAGGHGQGSRPCQLNHPTYIFVDRDQSVYVSDSWNNRVTKWTKGAKEGIVVAGGQGRGKNLTQLDCPTGVTIDASGAVYVADHWNNRIMRWGKNAKHGDIIAGHRYTSGTDSNQLTGPTGLVFDEAGNLYVSDSYNHRVQRYAIKED
ncbi:unnamed protein product [Adineta steineri]|uniref:Peptidase C14 caspase domain-containing protein n=1 Tax=Adineta steineri TaxID=433720 RepID=A0A814H3N6_9BILA|nr:unnamed protein product [Adineta steineri]